MSVKRTERGSYKVRWREADGTARSRTFMRKVDADQFHSEVRAAKAEGRLAADPMWRRMLRSQLTDRHEITESSLQPHGYFVYLLWPASDDRPIYVGRSSNVIARLGNHMADPSKASRVTRITLVRCYSEADMADLEVKLIRFYNPELNVADSLTGECAACGEACRGRSLYCSDACRRLTRSAARKQVPPPSPTLSAISDHHRRASLGLRPVQPHPLPEG